MLSISLQNETVYTVTDLIAQYIRRDVQEYFGEAVRTIRLQEGLDRHVFNVRTGEVRYAFSPQDFGLLVSPSAILESRAGAAISPLDDDLDADDSAPHPTGRPSRNRARRRHLG